MEEDKQVAVNSTHPSTPELTPNQTVDVNIHAPTNQPEPIRATGFTAKKSAVAATASDADSSWDYALIGEHVGAADTRPAHAGVSASHFLALFRESFHEFRQSAEHGKLLLGEQAKWQPTLRDAHGRQIGQLNHVLLNPVLPQLGNRPIVELILPSQEYRQAVVDRISHPQRQALEQGRPVVFLERRMHPEGDSTVQTLLALMTPPTTDQPQQIKRAMQEYRQAQATNKPEDVSALRHSFERIVQHTLGLQGFRYETVLDKMLEVNPLQRVTFHPDINVLGKQPIHLHTVPVAYKGVPLQPAQIKNLLLGHSIEVVGIRDERRPGLYRASVRFNVLHNKMEGDSKREELRTENKADYKHHQREVLQRGSDAPSTLLPPKKSPQDQLAGSGRDTSQRPAFRPGR